MSLRGALRLPLTLVITSALSLCLGFGFLDNGTAQPSEQLSMPADFSLTPTFFQPAETLDIGTRDVPLYALHESLSKPFPGNAMTPLLAEMWTVAAHGLSIAFKLRYGVRFYNDDLPTAENGKFISP